MPIDVSYLNERPEPSEHALYFGNYISLVPNRPLLDQMNDQIAEVKRVFAPVAEARSNQIDAPYTWSLKQVLGHVIDGERVFSYRALRIGSGDLTPLPGFDQDAMVAGMDYTQVAFDELLDEWIHLRKSIVAMFSRFDERALQHIGSSDGKPVSARAIAYIIVGHTIHHLEIARKRLL